MSFLYNLFGRKGSQSDHSKYDRITFQINLSDNIPQFFESNLEKTHQEKQVTPDHPLYYEIFPQYAQKYIEYTTTENDTLSGISIKLNISQKKIQDLNGIGNHLYPGMTIKLPQGTDIQPLMQKQTEHSHRARISQILSIPNQTQNYKYQIDYCAGVSGDIKGTLSINPNYIIFNPLIEDPQNTLKHSVQKLLKFNAIIETVDIQQVIHLSLPKITQYYQQGQPKTRHIVQMMLYMVGNLKIQKKYKERLKQLKIQHKAIASISFEVKTPNASVIAQEIVNRINDNIKNVENLNEEYEDRKRLTNIPFYDIIHENINPTKQEKQEQQMKSQQQNYNIMRESTVLGQLIQQSAIITNSNFSFLAMKLPLLYQLQNWTRIYSSTNDGTAFNTFLNKTKQQYPLILLIKEYKGYSFGAYLVEPMQLGKTGRGEMFIFSFKNKQQPQVYKWTARNDFFVYIEKENGVCIGMGISYGIFLKNTFQKGSSSATYTFGNKQPLSLKEDFLIEDIQVWTIQN